MFDTDRLRHNINKSSASIASSPFYNYLREDIIDRLSLLEKQHDKILLLGNNAALLANYAKNILSGREIRTGNFFGELDFPREYFDLVIFSYGLHNVADIPGFLLNIASILRKDGFFLCHFTGGGSLGNLRRSLIAAETEFALPHTPHISPFITLKDVMPLLNNAGFVENIVDAQIAELEYETPLLLMKDLQKLGEGNILTGVTYSIGKKIYNLLKEPKKDKFIDQINVISFLAGKTKKIIRLKA